MVVLENTVIAFASVGTVAVGVDLVLSLALLLLIVVILLVVVILVMFMSLFSFPPGFHAFVLAFPGCLVDEFSNMVYFVVVIVAVLFDVVGSLLASVLVG